MCSGPLGKFNGYFSIVSTLRGQYITANEPCQFYYQWSPAPRITTRLHTPPHLPGLTKTASLDQSVTPGPPLSTFWPVFFPLPSSTAFFVYYPCLCFAQWLCLWRKQHGSCSSLLAPPPSCFSPSFRLWPSPPRRVYRRPGNERARRRQRQPQASPGGPCLMAHSPSSSRISAVCCLVHMDQSASNRIRLLCWLPVLIPAHLPHDFLSGSCINWWSVLLLQTQEESATTPTRLTYAQKSETSLLMKIILIIVIKKSNS